MKSEDRKKAIEELKAEADDRYGADGWTSIYKVFTLPGGDTESVRVLNPKRNTDDASDTA